ncbi:WecB/TagA/CpsF family glycosyltransferase [Oceanobacter sp. 3_MG-2023]|uniref:WecB/TagA/CpsF family glycosyltransferase n=1 Tax=Oceanobacter sp. 3_MG-2023 TaxID=3062622 RepID=UPI002733EA84|nr:WecB/TagA/CpsF family glycosyltransferase [Oceanobacter sp. 3_MG-2023]MDP2505037.1 WecB/TagA/CpsF family glycosyltransferase [Oceanobacter sp. 3_MG-2023]
MKNKVFPVEIDDIPLKDVTSGIIDGRLNGVIVTPNVDHMCRIYSSNTFRDLYRQANLCVCDSKILQYISILKRRRINNVVRGSDLTIDILKECKGRKVLIVGSDENQAVKVKRIYGVSEVNLVVPSFGFINDPDEFNALVDEISSIEWDVAFFAVGSPQQEILAFDVLENMDCQQRTILCCGNAINFAIGNVSRSPKWMSTIGIEWFYRMIVEPRRMIPRYFKNLMIFYYTFVRGA